MNRAIVLQRAAKDASELADVLTIEERAPPPIEDGEVLVRAVYLSLDPSQFMWVRMAAPYMPIGAGDVMLCSQIGVIEQSRIAGVAAGDVVSVFAGMQERSVVRALGAEHDAGSGGMLAVNKISVEPDFPLDLHLSLLSHVGMAAISGMKHVAEVRAGETVLVSAAAGATGSIAAQLAKAYGARVIGVAGGPEKCALLVDELGLDGAIDHRGNVAKELARLAPSGIDLFFDNVGGFLLDTVLPQMAFRGRVVICGALADYGKAPDQVHRFANIGQLLQRNVKLLPYWVSDYDEHIPVYMEELRARYLDGSLKIRPSHIEQGLEAIPQALQLLMSGGNRGKLMVQVSDLPEGATRTG